MPNPCNLWVTEKGEATGDFNGPCEQESRSDSCTIYSVSHEVSLPTEGTMGGTSTGRRRHMPVIVTKEMDCTSPAFLQAMAHNEKIQEINLKFYRNTDSGDEEHYYTIKLMGSRVVSVKVNVPMTLDPENSPYKHMEEISFMYESIEWTYELTGYMTADDWRANK